MAYKDPEAQREYQRRWRAKHADKLRERARRYYTEHADAQRAAHRRGCAEHPDELRAYDRRYYTEHASDCLERDRRYRAEHPERCRARRAVGHTLASGKLVKEPCLFCDESKVQAHHHAYAKPLAVTWLCRRHHGIAHRSELIAR